MGNQQPGRAPEGVKKCWDSQPRFRQDLGNQRSLLPALVTVPIFSHLPETNLEYINRVQTITFAHKRATAAGREGVKKSLGGAVGTACRAPTFSPGIRVRPKQTVLGLG